MSRYEMWVWLVDDEDGEGAIATLVPGLPGVTPLQSRRLDVARKMEGLARAHGKTAVRLAHLVEVDDG